MNCRTKNALADSKPLVGVLHKFDLDENLDLKKASGGEKKKSSPGTCFLP